MLFMLGKEDILGSIFDMLRSLFVWICQIVYPGIATLYELFIEIGLLVYSDSFETVYNKISLIIGIFMVFRVTFWLIEMLVNPDSVTDKEKNPGKIIQKVITAVILLAVTPTLFKYAFKLQYTIVTSHTIEKIIAPSNLNVETTSVGRAISASLFVKFYTINKVFDQDPGYCENYAGEGGFIYNNLLEEGTADLMGSYCTTKRYSEAENSNELPPYVIDFNGLFATAVGIFVFWMILMYCISAGARYAQLIFLQIIAPIPIMCYLAPGKDNMFSKWVKQCTTTFIDLFIRIAIISFVLLLSELVLSNDNNVILNTAGDVIDPAVRVFLVLGLLAFAKKAPELVQELLPTGLSKATGDFGLSWKKRTDSMFGGKLVYGATTGAARLATTGVGGAAITAATGFATGRGLGGRFLGALGGAGRGLVAGTKTGPALKNIHGGIKKQNEINAKRIRLKADGSTFMGRMGQRFNNAFGFEGKAERFENDIAAYDKKLTKLNAKSSAYSEVSGSVGKMEDRATSQLDNKTFKPEQTYQRDLQTRRRNYKAMHQALANGDEKTALSIASTESKRVETKLSDAEAKLKQLVASGKKAGDKEYDEAKRERDIADKELARAKRVKESLEYKNIRDRIEELKRQGKVAGDTEYDAIVAEKDKRDKLRSEGKIDFVESYSAAQAEQDMTDVLTETRNEYITRSLKDKDGDVVIKNEKMHIEDVINHGDNREAFQGIKYDPNATSYEAYDSLSSDSKKASTALSREIYEAKTARDTIANSEAKKAADADRSAVGGQQGGKK